LSGVDGKLRVEAPQGVVTPQLREWLRTHKATLLAELTVVPPPPTDENGSVASRTYHGYTLVDLRAAAHPDEWAEINDKPEVLEVFARSLLERRQIEAGVVPERFTKLARCSGCGAVMVPATWPTERRQTRLGEYAAVEIWDEAVSCPWCRLRIQGKPYPRVHPEDEQGLPLPRPSPGRARRSKP
jgi:hypothetical protein